MWKDVNELMNKNMNKHELIHKPADNRIVIDNEIKISIKFNEHFGSVGKTSLKKLKRIWMWKINHMRSMIIK